MTGRVQHLTELCFSNEPIKCDLVTCKKMLSSIVPTSLSMTQGLLILLIVLITYVYLSWSPWKNLPPGPIQFPVIGSIPYLLGDIRVCLAKLAKKYGDVVTVYMGPQRMVILNGYETIKQAFVTQAGDFDERSEMFDALTGHVGVITGSGDHWKQHRRLLLRAMRDFGLLGHRMETMIHEESQRLVSVLHKMSGTPYDMEPILKKAVSSIISRLFGRHWDYDDPEFIEQLKMSDEVMLNAGTDNPTWTFKKLRYLPGDPFKFHKSVRMFREIRTIYKGWINEHQKRIDEGEEPEDIIGLYLKEMAKERGSTNSEFSIEALASTMMNTYLAGTDTTSNTIIWCLLHLILNPHIQAKVQAEIDDVVGRDTMPRIEDRGNMPYTEAVISETQRWCDLLPLSVAHNTRVERELMGYTIPANTMIIPNLNSVHYDPKLWPQPHVFDPERFLEDGKYKARAELIPFSIGKHMCAGEGLAKMELFLFLTHLLQTFTFSVPPGQPKPSTEGNLGITYMAKPYDVIMKPRQ